MKVVVQCRSMLIQKALEYYLKDHIVDLSEAEFVVGDAMQESKLPIFWVGRDQRAHLPIPFTRSMLMNSLKKFVDTLPQRQDAQYAKKQKLEQFLKEIDKRHKNKLNKILSDYHVKS